LIGRDALLKRAVQYTEEQEHVIMELRNFIEQYNIDLVKAMETRNAGLGRAQYQKTYGGQGKPKLDRMLSTD
jgi:hypothetical protein